MARGGKPGGETAPARAKNITRTRTRPESRLKERPETPAQNAGANPGAQGADGRWEGKLSDEQKEFVVTALACFDRPSEVRAALKEEFGVEIAVQSIEAYNPERAAGKSLAKQWVALFNSTRADFLAAKASVPVQSKAVRLRLREAMARRAMKAGNIVVANEILNDVAREEGGQFTNVRALSGVGADGKPNGAAPTFQITIQRQGAGKGEG